MFFFQTTVRSDGSSSLFVLVFQWPFGCKKKKKNTAQGFDQLSGASLPDTEQGVVPAGCFAANKPACAGLTAAGVYPS